VTYGAAYFVGPNGPVGPVHLATGYVRAVDDRKFASVAACGALLPDHDGDAYRCDEPVFPESLDLQPCIGCWGDHSLLQMRLDAETLARSLGRRSIPWAT
jgi:hypothetical protein